MVRRLFDVFVSLAASTAPAAAATYYVDASAGNDGNSGASPKLPWKHAPGMGAYAGRGRLAAGDTVYFNSSGTWLASGTQGIYLEGGVTYRGDVWGGGQRATLRANSDIASALVRFKDHPTLPTVFQGFDVDGNHMVTNGIEFNHSFYAGPLTGATKRVDDVVVRNIWSRTSLGQYKYGVIVSNHGGSSGAVANVEILNSVIHDVSRDGVPIYPGDESAECIVRNVVVRANRVYNTGKDPDYSAGAGIAVKGRVIDATIENNYIAATKGAGILVASNETRHFGRGPAQVQIRNNIIAVDTAQGSIRIHDGHSGGDPKDIQIYGNLVFNNLSGAGLRIGPDLRNANTLRIYNNTFYAAPVVIDNDQAVFPVLELRNNIIAYGDRPVLVDPRTRITTHSNNFYAGAGILVVSGSRRFDSSTLPDFEANSLGGDPRFVDTGALPTGFSGLYGSTMAPNASGLAPSASSRAIDHGVALASPFDRSINSVSRPQGAGFDVGAYERAEHSAAIGPAAAPR